MKWFFDHATATVKPLEEGAAVPANATAVAEPLPNAAPAVAPTVAADVKADILAKLGKIEETVERWLGSRAAPVKLLIAEIRAAL
jgi:hypothetical protein